MWKQRWWFAFPLALAVAAGSARASAIRDGAGMFDPDAVREAEAKLDQVERESGVSTTIETIDSLEGRELQELAREHAERSRAGGIFILIPKKEHKFELLVSRSYMKAFPHGRRQAIEDAFLGGFKAGDLNAGLRDGVQTIGREVAAAEGELGGRLRQAARPGVGPLRGRPMPLPRRGQAGFGLGSLLGIGLVILAVLVGIRLLGSLFRGGSYGPQAGPGMGRPGFGPGGGPGYGQGYGPGGYGNRGGGFMSSLFGGIGGAMAGNWLYDQFSGRNHGAGGTYADTTGAESTPTSDTGGEWSGGASETGDWGGGGGSGDAGGDWGGGGGGDWGGGGGGGDWGGGGGDGGSW